ncbi:DNA-binding response regulator [Lachnoclostridium sp. An169]|uniref:response regulator transcription factor n=1 Tax=Lachnoclostridium sp. An169 TaxID=1965569 RepID=UPI000B364D02|nr:response regulator transcription factor [Lachnoclostridium sp. An169]OUP83591.1 DNA-binding response regulator [Lachnoclostridium sp. An169]HJA66573.1 response regulator transcription factor [Candidatus Mediterraneibacter cottocaccae]
MLIVIIEDDKRLRGELARFLKTLGYDTAQPDDFEHITDEVRRLPADLILMDVGLPFEDGYELCRKIRGEKPVPVIFVTSRDSSRDELESIRAGGIDFITKPYDTLILAEKIRRALALTDPNNFRQIERKGCVLDLHLSILRCGEREVELTRNEFRILYYFFMNDGRIISKEELLDQLWNEKFYLDENVLMVNMTRLKKKLREIGVTDLLENVRGKGWRL